MWDRRFLFANDAIIKKLRDFVPVVGNTHDLQTTRHELGRWFSETVSRINPRVKDGITSQGFYVIGADGKGYLFNNNRSVERVLEVLGKGLEQFKLDPPEKVNIASSAEVQPQAPQGTTVLRCYSRIRPVPLGSDDSNENLQRDHFWILPEEAKVLANLQVPASFEKRLTRFALVDAVRGEPDFWKSNEVRSIDFKVQRLSVGKVEITGRYSMNTASGSRGLEGSFEAEVTFKGEMISKFEGYADARAWGAGTYTPNPPAGKFPMKFAFVLAPKSISTVAPHAAMYGQEYLQP